jgi:hypothetical protein
MHLTLNGPKWRQSFKIIIKIFPAITILAFGASGLLSSWVRIRLKYISMGHLLILSFYVIIS